MAYYFSRSTLLTSWEFQASGLLKLDNLKEWDPTLRHLITILGARVIFLNSSLDNIHKMGVINDKCVH